MIALITAFGAVAIDRRFAQKDVRRDIYLKWLHLVDTQKVRFDEAQLPNADPDQLAIQFADDFIRIRNRLALIAPERVSEAIVKYQKAAERLAKNGVNGDRSADAVFKALDTLPEREKMLAAMRRDIRGWWRRKS